MEKGGGLKAIIFGGSGAVGAGIIKALDSSKAYSEVILILRRRLELPRLEDLHNSEKFNSHIVNFERIEDFRHLIEKPYDCAFYAIGVSSMKVDAKYHKYVEVELASKIIQMLAAGGTKSVHYLSCLLVEENSWLEHKRTKYQVEVCLRNEPRFISTSVYKMGGVISSDEYRGMMHPLQQFLAKYLDPFRLMNIDSNVLGKGLVYNSLRQEQQGNFQVGHFEIKRFSTLYNK